MKSPSAKRHFDWDRLEGRSCPSHAVAPMPVPVPLPSPTLPIERIDAYSLTKHQADLATVATGKDAVVFLGDSITDWFATRSGAAIWRRQIAPLGAADFGVKSDASQNVVWRVENGELAGKPKVAGVMVGTNDLTLSRSVDYTVAGIVAVVTAIRAQSPGTHVVLMGLLPRASAPLNPIHADVALVNAALAQAAPGLGATYLDINAQFLRPNGSIVPGMLLDGEHPTARGYQVWANAIQPILVGLLTNTTG
jgi:lysophospholipase L1-like esterase